MATCKANTQKGSRCSRVAIDKGLCTQHGASHNSHHKKKGKPRAGSAAAKALETAKKKAKFLKGFGQLSTVTAAAEHAGIDRRTHYLWLDTDPEYVRSFEEAKLESNDRLEAEARRRAMAGVLEDVYYAGEVVGQQTRKSDTLLIFLMKGAMPDKYRDRHEVTGADGGPIQHSSIDLNKLSPETLRAIKKDIRAAAKR